jgi:hypothetical protein
VRDDRDIVAPVDKLGLVCGALMVTAPVLIGACGGTSHGGTDADSGSRQQASHDGGGNSDQGGSSGDTASGGAGGTMSGGDASRADASGMDAGDARLSDASDVSSGATVGRYDPFELTLAYPSAALSNPWEQVTVTATVTAPSGKMLSFDGFYYDVDTYKVRFAPAELGAYHYDVSVSGPSGPQTMSGDFTAVASANHGFLRVHPTHPYRLIFEDGSIANAIGLNDCWGLGLTGSIDVGEKVDLDTYMNTYGDGGGGFNVFRWNPANCSFDVMATMTAAGNTYLIPEGKAGDQLLASAHAHGMHVMYTFFHLQQWGGINNPALADATKRAMRYAMARYGAYVDVWEVSNETTTGTLSDALLKQFADYVRAQDPYRRLVTNSWERASDWTMLDARSPHSNDYTDAVDEEKTMTNNFTTGVPVIKGEIYNTGSFNWDATSEVRMRYYAWSSFMGGLVDIYWNMSFKKGGTGAGSVSPNMYIGPLQRGFIAELQKLTAGVDPDVLPTTITYSLASGASGSTQAHALSSSTMLLAYVYRGTGLSATTAKITVDVPVNGEATWNDPATGAVLTQASVSSGPQTLTSPSFSEDIVLTVR